MEFGVAVHGVWHCVGKDAFGYSDGVLVLSWPVQCVMGWRRPTPDCCI